MAFDNSSFLEAVAATERELSAGEPMLALSASPMERVLAALKGGREPPAEVALDRRRRLRAPKLEAARVFTSLAGGLPWPDPGRRDYAFAELDAFSDNRDFLRAAALAAIGREPTEEEYAWVEHINAGVKSRLEVLIHLFLRGRAEGRSIGIAGIPRGAGVYRFTRSGPAARPIRLLVDSVKLPTLPRQLRLQDRAAKLKMRDLADACSEFARGVESGFGELTGAVDAQLALAHREIQRLRASCEALQQEVAQLREPPASDGMATANALMASPEAMAHGLRDLQVRTLNFMGDALDEFEMRIQRLERGALGPPQPAAVSRGEVALVARRFAALQRLRLTRAPHRRATLHAYIDAALQLLQGPGPGPWLQLGGGGGEFLLEGRARGLELYGLEHDPDLAAATPPEARLEVAPEGIERLWLGPAAQLGLVACLADSGLAEDWDARFALAAAARRALAPGGLLLIETLAGPGLGAPDEASMGALFEAGGFGPVSLFEPPQLREAGFGGAALSPRLFAAAIAS